MATRTKLDVVKTFAKAINATLGSPCDVSISTTLDQKYRITLEGFPLYPLGVGYLSLLFPQDTFSISNNGDIIPRSTELSQGEIRLFNGRRENNQTALIHSNIFDDGHPCLGSGASRVRIFDLFSLGTYFISATLRINMTPQSFLSPATRKAGANSIAMQSFKDQVRAYMALTLSPYVMRLDSESIRKELLENFNDIYRTLR